VIDFEESPKGEFLSKLKVLLSYGKITSGRT
jgi:hypothetical protein